MAEPSAAQANPLWVISPNYCVPHPVELAISRKLWSMTDGNLVVTDSNGSIILQVKAAVLTVHRRQIIVDAAGNPVVTIRAKIMSTHHMWQAFRGESRDSKDLLFSTKIHSVFNIKTKLDVFLAHNTTEESCDFKVEGNWFERSCVIYAGDSSTVTAKMHKEDKAPSILLGKENFVVAVHPNIDHAFVFALIVILDAIGKD